MVKTRPEDVDKDIVLPPMKHHVIYLKPCWFDKMTANLFIQVLRANAITSERTGVDYLFDKSSIKARHSLIRNLRQSNFTWTGFSLEDVANTLETSSKYLEKKKECSTDEAKHLVGDAELLLESSSIIANLTTSKGWLALSKAHEVGMAIENWPQDSEEFFALSYPEKPIMIGATQLLDGQSHVDSQILSRNPAEGLDKVGQVTKAKLEALENGENTTKGAKERASLEPQLLKVGVPSSCVGGQPLTSRRTSSITTQSSPTKTSPNVLNGSKEPGQAEGPATGATPASPVRPRKRKLTVEDEKAELPETSPLRDTRIVGTTSAKLTYLIEMVIKHQADEKIIIFYDGDNAAFYIAQCLEFLHINHRIYARTLDNTKRSEYVALFNEDADIRVLLIDVACGALGLNLNAASIVLIVNPINRPGIEAQAIKRAHRIGQTKAVLVQTLVLEGTIEEAIFKRAKKMSRSEHLEAKELEDDSGITQIIQNAPVLPIDPNETNGLAQFALLQTPQQVFGRPGRDKYHKVGHTDRNDAQKPRKKARTAAARSSNRRMDDRADVDVDANVDNLVSMTRTFQAQMPILGSAVQAQTQTQPQAGEPATPSLFGIGNNASGGSLFG